MQTVEKDLWNARDVETEATTRLDAVNTKVQVLETDAGKQSKEVARTLK